MDKHFIPMLSAVIILLLTSCTKHDPIPDCLLQSCRITQLQNHDPMYGNDYSADFSYDAKGNPLRIVRSNVSTGAPNFTFRHDAKNRITDVIGSYGDGGYGDTFEFWHRLKYDAKNRVFKDSSFTFGRIGPNPEELRPGIPLNFYVTNYTYDAQNRISRLTSADLLWDHRYYYNNKGNLDSIARNNYTSVYADYDSTVNYNRTNPLWQFLDRDYSQNNAATVSAVNKYGLPITIAYNNKIYGSSTFLGGAFILGDVTFKYACN